MPCGKGKLNLLLIFKTQTSGGTSRSSHRVPFKTCPWLNLRKKARYRGQTQIHLGEIWLDLATRTVLNAITVWLIRDHSLKQSSYFQDMNLLVVNASYWWEWVMGHISQGWDTYNSQVNDVQNLGQMRSNCNLPSLSGQDLLEGLQIMYFRRFWLD